MKITAIAVAFLFSPRVLGSTHGRNFSAPAIAIGNDEGVAAAIAANLFDPSSIGDEDGGIAPLALSPTPHRVVEYNLTIGYFIASPDGVPVNVLGINGQLPSPTLEVTQGHTLAVNVINEDPAHAHSLHWHGLSMKGSPEMDGVVGITQCSLRPLQQMQYRFTVDDEPGTYWYHGHSGLNKVGARGIAGMLIVHAKDEEGKDPHKDLYTEELGLFMQDWSHESPHDHYAKSRGGLHPPVAQSANAHNVALYPWTSGLINGIGGINNKYSILSLANAAFDNNTGARLRIVNGGENFALRVSVDNHRLLVISTDGMDTEPLPVDSIIAHLGERYDAVLIPRNDDAFNQAEGNHWIRASTLETDEGAQVPMVHDIKAILRYAGSADTFPTTSASSLNDVILNCFDVSIPSLDKGTNLMPSQSDPDEIFEHSRGSKHYGHFTRIRPNVFEMDRSYNHREGNYTQFVLPYAPTMYNLSSSKDGYHDHTLHLDLHHGNNVQLIWNHRSRTSHPIHIHGYKFIIAATHEADVFNGCSIVDCPDEKDWFRWPLDRNEIDKTIRSGKFIVKDTAVIPAGGYLVTRFKADNPGHWIAHCHTDFHLADGMGVILREGNPQLHVPPNFPTCEGDGYEAYDPGAMASHQPACQCLNDPETILHAAPESAWKCSTESLCRHDTVINEGTPMQSPQEQVGRERIRGIRQGRDWTRQITTIGLSVLLVTVVVLTSKYGKPSMPNLSNDINEEEPTFSYQVLILIILVLRYEWKKYMNGIIIVQVCGLAIVGGLIYLDAGYDVTERGFGEKIAFIFWQCAFWSVSTIYSSIVTYHCPDWKEIHGKMVWIESLRKSSASSQEPQTRAVVAIGVGTFHLARSATSLVLAAPWPILFALISDSLTQMAPSVTATLATGSVLLLTQQAFDSMGCFLAEVNGPEGLTKAVCLGTIVSQLLVIAGGFYRTVPSFISAVGPIRYAFAAISKLTFSASQSFWCTPERAMAWRGYTWCSTELSGAVADLKIRGLNVMDSSSSPRVWPDVVALIAFNTFFRCGGYVMAHFNIRRKNKKVEENSGCGSNDKSANSPDPLSEEPASNLSRTMTIDDQLSSSNPLPSRQAAHPLKSSLKSDFISTASTFSTSKMEDEEDKLKHSTSSITSNHAASSVGVNPRRRSLSRSSASLSNLSRRHSISVATSRRPSLNRSSSLLSIGSMQDLTGNESLAFDENNDVDSADFDHDLRRSLTNNMKRSGSLLSIYSMKDVSECSDVGLDNDLDLEDPDTTVDVLP